jgi:hypothetical protein
VRVFAAAHLVPAPPVPCTRRRSARGIAAAQRCADGGAGDGGAQHPSSTPPRSWRCMCARRVARWARRRRWRPRSARSACRRRRLVRRASSAPSGKAGCEEVAGGTRTRGLIIVCHMLVGGCAGTHTADTESEVVPGVVAPNGQAERQHTATLCRPPSPALMPAGQQAECAAGQACHPFHE